MINVQINGKKELVAGGSSVSDLLKQKGLNPNTIACELNLQIIKRAALNETKLRDGDELEIIQMIGGG